VARVGFRSRRSANPTEFLDLGSSRVGFALLRDLDPTRAIRNPRRLSVQSLTKVDHIVDLIAQCLIKIHRIAIICPNLQINFRATAFG